MPQVEPNGGQRKQAAEESAALGDPGDRLDLQGVKSEEQGAGAGGDAETPAAAASLPAAGAATAIFSSRRRIASVKRCSRRAEKGCQGERRRATVRRWLRAAPRAERQRPPGRTTYNSGECKVPNTAAQAATIPCQEGGLTSGLFNDLLRIVPVEELQSAHLAIDDRDNHDQQQRGRPQSAAMRMDCLRTNVHVTHLTGGARS